MRRPTENGHSPGTAPPQPAERQRQTDAAQDKVSSARLLSLKAAGDYLGVSYWTVRDLVAAGELPAVKLPCPRAHDGRAMRRTLVDRVDLDRLIERWKECESR